MKRTISIVLALSLALVTPIAAFADTTTIYSDTSVMVYDVLDYYAPLSSPAWVNPEPAVITWKHPSWPTLDPASWISDTYYIEGNIAGNTWRRFSKTVELCEGAYDISGEINATADNAEEAYVNGTLVGFDGETTGSFIDNHEWNTIQTYYFVASADTLIFDFIVRNYSGTNSATGNPTGLIFNATVNYSCPIEVQIDIKPGSYPNSINLKSKGVLPVAVLTTEDFDATTIDPATVTLAGASPLRWAWEDVDSDGDIDLLFHFKTQELNLNETSTEATLEGFTMGGVPFFGTDTVNIVP
jgi:hypothetical protein